MMFEDLHVTLSPRLSAVRSLSRMVEEFGDANQLPEPKIYMVNLALDELITNAVTYGFEGSRIRRSKSPCGSPTQPWS